MALAVAASLAMVTAGAATARPVVLASGAPPGFECLELSPLPASPIDPDSMACPGPVPANCDPNLADQPTAEGYRCRDHIFATSCDARPPGDDMKAWCQSLREGRWGACLATGHRTEEFTIWCEREEERRTQLNEPLNDPGLPNPATPVPSTPPPPDPNQPIPAGRAAPVDPASTLGRDPFCARSDLTGDQVLACRASGSVQHPYPFSNYGIDNNVEVDFFRKDFWNGDAPFKSAVQWICVQIWQILIWVVKMTLLMLAWAFARDPFGIAMGQLATALERLHEDVLGTEWTLAALTVAGLWGIWNGLVRLRIIQTIGGLAATLLLMIGALWIIYAPGATIGFLNRTANEAALSLVSAASSGTFAQPGGVFADRQHGLFGEVIEKPWCALQFSSVDYCLADRNNDGVRNIDLWLTFPAGSAERAALYSATKGQEVGDPRNVVGQFEDWWQSHVSPIPSVRAEARQRRDRETAPQQAAQLVEPNPEGVAIQGKDGTFTRLGLLAILAFGMIGAIALFLWLAVRLIGAAVISLLLLVLAPVMMLAAAFGEEGRTRFGNWLKALVGAVLAKLIYALLLALVLLVSRILADLPLTHAQAPGASGTGAGNFLGSWLLQSAFWWTALIRRDRVLGFVSFDPAGERDGMGALSRFHFGYSALRNVTSDTRKFALWAPKKGLRIGGRATRAGRRAAGANRRGTDEVIGATASGELDHHADRAIRTEREDDFAKATRIMERGRGIERWISDIDTELGKTNDPALSSDLRHDRTRLKDELVDHRNDPKTRWASAVASRDAGGVRPTTASARRAWQDRRREDIANWERDPNTWDSRRNRQAAGISDGEWESAQNQLLRSGESTRMDTLRARSVQALGRDRDLFARSSSGPLDRQIRGAAIREYRADPDFAFREAQARRAAREGGGNDWRGRGRVPGRRR